MRDFIRAYNERLRRHGAPDQPLHGRRGRAVPARHRDRQGRADLRRRARRAGAAGAPREARGASGSSGRSDARDLAPLGTVVSHDDARGGAAGAAGRGERRRQPRAGDACRCDLTVEDPPLEEVMRELFARRRRAAAAGRRRRHERARHAAGAAHAAAHRLRRGGRLPRRDPGLDADHHHAARHARAVDAVARDGAGRRASTSAGFAAYFLATFVVRQLTGAWVAWEINWRSATARWRCACCARSIRCVPTRPRTWPRCRMRVMVALPVAVISSWSGRAAARLPHDPVAAGRCCALSLLGGWLLNFLVNVAHRHARVLHREQHQGDRALAGAVLRLLRLPAPARALPAWLRGVRGLAARSASCSASRWS